MNCRFFTLTFVLWITCTTISAAPQTWALRFDGIGPVKIGMNLHQLNAVLNERFSIPEDQDQEPCFYVDSKRHPGIGFMIEHGYVTRVDIIDRRIFTTEGIHIGDTEERVAKAYGQKLQIEPQQYVDDGHYLTILSRDRRYGIRFETEEGKVTDFYAGETHAISYVEGYS